jgi:hypothetical protein
MIPFLIGGVLIYLIGSLMLLVAAFGVGMGWGLLCLFFPPVQLLFMAMHWNKVWDALLMQVFGIAMVVFFIVQMGGFDRVAVQQEWVKFQRQQGLIAVTQTSATTTITDTQSVQAVTAPATSGGMQSVGDNGGVVSVTGVASKAVDDKPIYKCTDKNGVETYSRTSCAGKDK